MNVVHMVMQRMAKHTPSGGHSSVLASRLKWTELSLFVRLALQGRAHQFPPQAASAFAERARKCLGVPLLAADIEVKQESQRLRDT
jgi:hypothetical protein